MIIDILTVGKLKRDNAYLVEGIEEYSKRLKPYAKLRWIEVNDESISASKTRDQVLETEAQRIAPHLERKATEPSKYIIVLSEWGQRYTSEDFARELFTRAENSGNTPNGGIPSTLSGHIIIIVGGALGLSRKITDQAHWVVSLSPMTFPHQLVRLILIEQLYRAFKINLNEPYHK